MLPARLENYGKIIVPFLINTYLPARFFSNIINCSSFIQHLPDFIDWDIALDKALFRVLNEINSHKITTLLYTTIAEIVINPSVQEFIGMNLPNKKIPAILALLLALLILSSGCLQQKLAPEQREKCLQLASHSKTSIPKCETQEQCFSQVNANLFNFPDAQFSNSTSQK